MLAAHSMACAQYKIHEWANFEKNALPADRILFGGAPAETISVQDLSQVSPSLGRLVTEETGQFAMSLKSRPQSGNLWATALAIGQVLDRDMLGPNTRALFQADFYFPAEGPIPNLAVLAIEPPPDAIPGHPQAKGATIKKFYRFGISLNTRLYFSLLNPSAESGKADLYLQDQTLIEQIPRPGWHRFAIVCQGPEMIRCYVDGREASFSPINDKALRKVIVGVMLADKTNTYDAYADNLSIQISDEAPRLPDSPYSSGWTIASGPSTRAIRTGVETQPTPIVPAPPPVGEPMVAAGIPWHQPVAAWGKAQRDNLPLLLYFFAPGLSRNESLEAIFATDPSARNFLQQHICARVDVNQLQGGAVAQQYGINRVPTLMVIPPDARTYKKAVPGPNDTWLNLQQQLSAN